MDFPVEHGKALGRRLQFPTINQPIPPQMVLPRLGVYATMARVNGKVYAGVTNIGVRPTVEKGMAPRAETYLIGFPAICMEKRCRWHFCLSCGRREI